MATDADALRSRDWSEASFWREFAPSLRVGDRDFLASVTPLGVAAGGAETLRYQIKHEGYVQMAPVNWNLPIETMAELVTKLDGASIPVPFAFVYDEFWLMFLRLHRIIEELLGPGYLRLPDFWVWYVDPGRGDSGWSPHRDKTTVRSLREDGTPMSLTTWIPLSVSNPLNGCIYVVPATRDPTYNTQQNAELQFDVQDVRALPCAPGSILMWNHEILHWGARTSKRETRPRISAAFEFQAADVPPFNEPVMQANMIPSFDQRVRLIGKQILQYQHMYPLDPAVEQIAHGLLTTRSAG